jgi:KaiC/GvpD/RAD55 family RecA-like ATPase
MPYTSDLSEDMMGYDVRKIPTGVADFDAIINGGLPDGSLVLLLGEVGAGQHEFVYTSASKIAVVKEHPHMGVYYLGHFCDFSTLPDNICYVTFSRSKEDILREIATSFNDDFYGPLSRKMKFKDFSASYFQKSIVPSAWTEPHDGKKELFSGSPKEDVLESLVNFLDENAHNSLVIIDSLTDLVISNLVDPKELVQVLKGIQRAAKRWKGIIYLLLTRDIVDKRVEQMLIDSVDGVLVFEWSKYLRSTKRQRYIYVEKFMSLLPHLENERTGRFPTMVSAHSGLTVVNMEMIA